MFMNLITPIIVVENTANPGQLQSITDTVPYYKCGQVAYGPNYATEGDLYVYGRNALASGAMSVGAFGYVAQPYYSATSGVDWNLGFRAKTDLVGVSIPVVAQVAIPNLYYGWAKFAGDITSLTGCVSETRVVGDQLTIYDATCLVRAVATQVDGVNNNAFAIVTTANTVSATTCTACRLLGRAILSTT